LSINVEGNSDLGLSSVHFLPHLKRWYYLWHCVRLTPLHKPVGTSEKSPLNVSQFETEFNPKQLLLKILHFTTCKNSPRVLNTHSFKRCGSMLSNAASVRIKLKVPATQRHHRELAACARYFISSVSLWTAYIL
jgi:hypothetical protein